MEWVNCTLLLSEMKRARLNGWYLRTWHALLGHLRVRRAFLMPMRACHLMPCLMPSLVAAVQ